MVGEWAPLKSGWAAPPLLGSITGVVGAGKWGGLVRDSKLGLVYMTLAKLPMGLRIQYFRGY